VWRHVGTLGHVAHVAEVALIHDLPVGLLLDPIELTRAGSINGIEERREGITQVETAATALTNVEDTLQFFEQ
jgi:hypothetical protein